MTTESKNPLIDIEAEVERYQLKLEGLNELDSLMEQFTDRDRSFASDLCRQFVQTGGLSPKQWDWVERLCERVRKAEPIYGNFDAIHVMFRLSGEHLKFPKIRLMTAEDTYVELRFYPETKDLKIFRDGWQGHGYRKFVGWIKDNQLIPYRADRLTDDIRTIIQEFALDPAAVAKAMALKLGSCLYCGQRLSDHESKHRGYGPICAKHYGLPWDKNSKFKAA